MGKAGGFFKRLKTKQKKQTKKASRGTTGMSSEDRRLKHNATVDIYATRRKIAEIDAVSSSSEDDSVSSDDGIFIQQKAGGALDQLRSLLGVSDTTTTTQGNGNGEGADSGDEADSALSTPFDYSPNASASEASDEEDGVLEGDEEIEEEEGEEGEEYALPEDQWDDLFTNIEGATVQYHPPATRQANTTAGRKRGRASDPADDAESEESEEMDDEEDGEAVDEFDAEDEFDGAASDEEHEESTRVLLPAFSVNAKEVREVALVDAAILGEDIVRHDPWFQRFHARGQPAEDLSSPSQPPLTVSASIHWKDGDVPVAVRASAACSAAVEGHARHAAAGQPAFVHPVLWRLWCAFRAKQTPGSAPAAAGALTADEASYFRLLASYSDVLDASRSWEGLQTKRSILALHLLNHWFKSQSLVTGHNAVLARRRKTRKGAKATKGSANKGKGKKAKAAPQPDEDVSSSDDEDVDFRDQGFGRTRMLVMLPMRNAALDLVEELLRILYAEAVDDLSTNEVLEATMGGEAAWHRDGDPYKIYAHTKRPEFYTNPRHVKKLDQFRRDFSEIEESLNLRTFRRRPEDFRRVFYGNIDDSFCIGMSLGVPASPSPAEGSAKPRVSIYSHVLASDIIICSPLGLRKRLGKSGDVLVSLSSVEVCVVDQADVMQMQNFEHAQEVLKLLNRRPTETTEGLTQISRVYEHALRTDVATGAAARRQNVMITALSHSTLQSTFRTSMVALGPDGPFKCRSAMAAPSRPQGVLSTITLPIRQHFTRFAAETAASCDDDRFQHFSTVLFPSRIQPLMDREVRTIIFVPSYFDFVRLRTFLFEEHRESVAFLSEYSTEKQQRQVLGQFTDLERPLLVMTERFYFFRRYFVRLAEALVFYSPPMTPGYYPNLISKLNADSPHATVITLFSRYDTHELTRIAGADRTRQLLERPATSFAFITNSAGGQF